MKDRTFNFITGLPRSGSTLMSAILRQNPLIEAGMTSPVGGINGSLRTMMTQNREIDSLIDDDGRRRILRGVFEGYYADTKCPIIFDTNRSWSSRIAELLALFPDVKMIAMVRDPAWILDSVERITRTNPIRQSGMLRPGATIDARAEAYIKNDGFIGGPMGYLREGLFGPDSDRIILVEYDALCAAPEKTMDAIYSFFGLDPFEHDYGNVEYEQEAFDAALRTPGLHTVRGAVEYKPRKTILPPDLFQRFSNMTYWRTESLPTKCVRIIPSEDRLQPAHKDGLGPSLLHANN